MAMGTFHRFSLRATALCVGVLLPIEVSQAAAFAEFVDPNPSPGNQFGATVVALSTGNVVIASPRDDAGGSNAGAVYLFNGATGALISTLVGATANDFVGSGGVTALTNGNYVISSPSWNNGAVDDAGAATWGNGTSGVSGVVSAANSLVGSTLADQVGGSVVALANGNYVVSSVSWSNGGIPNAGAVTWGSGTTGVSGTVSAANSLVGSSADDFVGSDEVRALANGNYVVRSALWDNGANAEAGAVTWGSGTTGVSGAISAANSLIGSAAFDQLGWPALIELSNGNYVVLSTLWDNGAITDAGAVTWASGTSGVSGVVSAANSLVGSTAGDQVGTVTALSNGNYVVSSGIWDNGASVDVGAVTWGDGTTGVTGAVTAANSLVGATAGDNVGSVTALTNGNYVVGSSNWDNGAIANVGAATWVDGTGAVSGTVTAANSLVGSTANDQVGVRVTALSNGNYVVTSSFWNNGATSDAGAATWGDGASGTTGTVSAANSLVGSAANDRVGNIGVTTLSNGNYVVGSSLWDNGAMADAGAVTWGDGSTGVIGAVSAANSLVGSTAGDRVGVVFALTNGNYLALSSDWDNGAVVNAGAVTWGSGTSGVIGTISAANSLVGSTANDRVGISQVTTLSNGNYVVASNQWDNGAITDAGAVTWGNGMTGTAGAVSAANSLVGSTNFDRVGTVTALSNGDYVVASPNWSDGILSRSGAATWGDGTSGVTGTISAANSLLGAAAMSGLQTGIIEDGVNGTFSARFLTEGGGRVRVGPESPAVSVGPPLLADFHADCAPNPTSGPVAIRFRLPGVCRASVRIFDLEGRAVSTLVEDVLPGGDHHVTWDRKLRQGRTVAPGVYLVEVRAGSLRQTNRIVVLR